MKIFFHLGSYKTGSTSFQNTLFNNREMLLDSGILYPNSGITNEKNVGYRHTPLILNFINGDDDACPDSLLQELTSSEANFAIISSEAWSNPAHLSHLTRLISVLKEHGYHDCNGLLSLRNLASYQVKHYREFTLNRGNSQTFPEYVQKRSGMFDYLFLARSFQSIFESKVTFIPFDSASDVRVPLFNAMQFGKIFTKLEKVKRANIPSVSPLEIEAIRCANYLRKPKEDAFVALSLLLEKNVDWVTHDWTENSPYCLPPFSNVYVKNLAQILNWNDDKVPLLLRSPIVLERNVQEVSGAIMKELERI